MPKKTIIFIVLLFVFFGILPSYDVSIRTGRTLIAEWAVIALCALFFLKNNWIKAFLIWALVRSIMGWNKYSFLTLHTIFVYLVFYQVMINEIKEEYIDYILNCICVLALINFTLMILQYYGTWVVLVPKGEFQTYFTLLNGWIVFTPQKIYPVLGFLSNINMTSAFMAICLPAFFRKRWIFAIPLIIVSLLLAKSLSGLIPAFIAICLYIVIKCRKYRLFIVGGLSIAFVAYLFKTESTAILSLSCGGRLAIYKAIAKYIIPIRPIVGWGVGQFKYLFPIICKNAIPDPIPGVNVLQAHNDFLQLWVEMGVIGFTLVCGYLFSLFRKAWRMKDYILLLGILIITINANFNFLLHTTGGVLFLVYAVLIEKKYEDQKRRIL